MHRSPVRTRGIGMSDVEANKTRLRGAIYRETKITSRKELIA